MIKRDGWIFDLYASREDGLVIWILGEDGERYKLRQNFPITFYASGPSPRLRELWQYIKAQPKGVTLSKTQRRDLFQKESVTVLAVTVHNPAEQPFLFKKVSSSFSDLTYYDTDIRLSLRHSAVYGTFPLARCRMFHDQEGWIQSLDILDSPWDPDPYIPPLKVMSFEPNVDPFHAAPTHIWVKDPKTSYRLDLKPERALLINLRAILERHDPDLIVTNWGDTWLLPHVLDLSKKLKLPLPLNRDSRQRTTNRPERSYFAYGQVIYRGRQVHLFGRWHVDGTNAVMFHDYGMEGIYEMARVTSLPVQTAARVSPGTGISSMQILTALRQDILVPWHKQQAERGKTALDLLRADHGGLVYQPIIGLHRDVAEIDFVSMYPSVMSRFNISPETVGVDGPASEVIPELGVVVDQGRPGLVPQTLSPLLDKRVLIKTRLMTMPSWDPRRKNYQARASAHKWLLVTCFGYLGYKNARFGRIEAHEAVTAFGREMLLQAKEASEDLGYQVLHLYVDGMWVRKQGASRVSDFQPLLDEIIARTGLPITLDGIYRWVAFLPSRMDERVPVANRYFGVFQDGSLKMRGIETRRRDTPPFVFKIQMEILRRLAEAETAVQLPSHLPGIVAMLQGKLNDLRAGRIPVKDLLVTQKLSRELEEYRVPSPAARAASQLQRYGKSTRPGQKVRFIYMLGDPGVHAWNLPDSPNPKGVDVSRYIELLIRASNAVLQPLGVSEDTLRDWVLSNAGYASPPGYLASSVPSNLLRYSPSHIPRLPASIAG